jgi:gamma-glutamylcyclotransferase (GGCT)/AIG2-like uncharacterized protein YtfP
MTRLFFYGTLMADDVRGSVLDGLARRVDDATISGDLYDVHGGFPALVPGAGRVVGEVWEILPGYGPSALAITDRIEGYRPANPAHSMYVRRTVNALLPDGSEVLVETYEWNGSTARLRRIDGGSWRSYRNAPLLPIEAA